MKKLLLLVMLTSVLGACNKQDEDLFIRQCGDYTVEMDFSDDGSYMNADINGDEVILERVISASGAKYSGVLNDTNIVMWGKGDEWTMLLDDDMIISCVAE